MEAFAESVPMKSRPNGTTRRPHRLATRRSSLKPPAQGSKPRQDRLDSRPMESMHPLGADAPKEDYVGLAFGALVFSFALSVGLNACVAFAVATLRAQAALEPKIDLSAPPAVALLWGTLLACFASAVATWRWLAPIQNGYRQGALAMVSFFAGFVVTLLMVPVNELGGRPALGILALAAFAAAALIARRIASAPPAARA